HLGHGPSLASYCPHPREQLMSTWWWPVGGGVSAYSWIPRSCWYGGAVGPVGSCRFLPGRFMRPVRCRRRILLGFVLGGRHTGVRLRWVVRTVRRRSGVGMSRRVRSRGVGSTGLQRSRFLLRGVRVGQRIPMSSDSGRFQDAPVSGLVTL